MRFEALRPNPPPSVFLHLGAILSTNFFFTVKLRRSKVSSMSGVATRRDDLCSLSWFLWKALDVDWVVVHAQR